MSTPHPLLALTLQWCRAERLARQTEADVLAGKVGPDAALADRRGADRLYRDLFRAAEAHLEATERPGEVRS